MIPAYIQRISALLKSIRELTGIPAIWKNAAGIGEEGLDLEQYQHQNPFCMAVKQHGNIIKKCVHDDIDELLQKCKAHPKPFLKQCHAGVIELVIPLFDNQRFEGMLFFGPVRGPNARCAYARTAAQFQDVAVHDPEIFSRVETILSLLGHFILNEREQLFLQEHAAGIKSKKVENAVHYIHKNLASKFGANDVATACSLSASRFVHLFKEELGIPFSTYVNKVRVERAKRLLLHSNMKTGQVGFEVGFADQNYFSAAFKRLVGCSPRRFRKERKASVSP